MRREGSGARNGSETRVVRLATISGEAWPPALPDEVSLKTYLLPLRASEVLFMARTLRATTYQSPRRSLDSSR